MVGKQTEQAVLIVNGHEFRDWESVMVRHARNEQPAYRFRFTCSEEQPIAANFGVLQIKPGDECEVFLAGHKAVSGKVSTRQVYYDKRRHYIEIQGVSWTDALTASSPITKTMEYKNVTFEQFARSTLKPYNIPFKVEGGQIPQLKFPRISMMHGLSSFDHLDLYARCVGVGFTSDPDGSFVARVGPNQERDVVEEGENILVGREIIFNTSMESTLPGISQQTGNNKKHGPEVASVPYFNETLNFFGKAKLPFTLVNELPTADTNQIKGRGHTENQFLSDDRITVFVTVYGWLRPSGGLWDRNQKVHVKSPMLILDEELEMKSVTFTQDSGEGTLSVLELCNPLAMGGNIPQAIEPGSAQGSASTSGAAAP